MTEPTPLPEPLSNPAHLVETEDMPMSPQPEPYEPSAPQRNVTEPAESPDVPNVPPQQADEPIGGQVPTEIADPDVDTSP